MTSKEIIRRIVEHDAPVRFGFDFSDPAYRDLTGVASRRYKAQSLWENPYDKWGNYPELKKLTGFSGEVRMDLHRNIYGRFNGKTKGECIRGAITDWSEADNYFIPKLDPSFRQELLARNIGASDKFVITSIGSLFSQLRDARLIANALADTVEEPEALRAFMDRITDHEVEAIRIFSGCGIDAAVIADDLGTQDRTFISPNAFRSLFKPYYKKVADALHEGGMKFFMHSCGYIYAFIEDLIEVGVDALQFDQPDVYPTETLALEFARRVTFWSPVDIQKVLPTGDRAVIETRAREMCELFRAAGGGFIAKDYPTYGDIGVDPEWAVWARDVIVRNSRLP